MNALEALNDLSKLVFIYGGVEQYKTIEKELKEHEALQDDFNKLYERTYKEHKALEIIKNKTNFTKTNDGKKALVFVILENQEEYDLLKEVLL